MFQGRAQKDSTVDKTLVLHAAGLGTIAHHVWSPPAMLELILSAKPVANPEYQQL